MIQRRIPFWIPLFCWFLPGVLWAQTDRDALIGYLKKHQLYELYAELLESDLSNATAAEDKSAIIKQLAETYAERLSTPGEDYAKYNFKLNDLLRDNAGAIPYSVHARISFARFRNAKGWFEEWIWKRDKPELKKRVSSEFDGVLMRSREVVAQIQSDLMSPEISAFEKTQLEAALAQFQYLIAWSQYYKSIANDDQVGRDHMLAEAKQNFDGRLT